MSELVTGEEFAKTFKINGKQVLIYWELSDDDNSKYDLNQMVKTDFGEVNLALKGMKYESVMECFNSYESERAKSFLEGVENSLQSMCD